MKFSVKIVLSMLFLLSFLFGIGGSLMISFSFNEALEREKSAAYTQISDKNAGSWTALRLYMDNKTLYNEGSFNYSVNDVTVSSGNCAIKYFFEDNGNHFLLVTGSIKAGDDI